jgi:hypothetical protein
MSRIPSKDLLRFDVMIPHNNDSDNDGVIEISRLPDLMLELKGVKNYDINRIMLSVLLLCWWSKTIISTWQVIIC